MRSLLLACVILLGCAKPLPPQTLNAGLRNLSPAQDQVLQSGRYPILPSDKVILQWMSRPDLSVALTLSQKGYYVDIGSLRNPGAYVYMVRSRNGNPLEKQDITELEALVKSEKDLVWVPGKIPMKLGPDARTPLVMKSISTYAPEKFNKPVPITTSLLFARREDALKAAEYIDKGSYKVQVKDKRLRATCTAPNGANTEEWEAFEPLALKFGGKVEYVEGEDPSLDQ